MAGKPSAERPPAGLSAHWTHTWTHALKVLKAQGTWAWEQKPLLDEYVFALRESQTARELAEADPYHETDKGLLHPHPGFAQADRAARRALVLADALKLTPEQQRKLGTTSSDEPEDEWADLYGDSDKVTPIRRKAG